LRPFLRGERIAVTSTRRDAAALPSCPYPGLRPFRADEAVVFFGRDTQVDELLERLGRKRFVAVVGTSGCGKSSLVRARLIPALGTGLLGSAGARWAVATMRPGDRPLWQLAQALLDPAVLGPAWSDLEYPAGQLHAMLQRGPLGLVEVLDESPLAGGRKLLLIVDQFEELFRYRREGEGQRDEANAFVSLLLASARAAEPSTYVVLTMRSDYLGDCALFDGLPEALNDSQFLTPKLTREQRQRAIEAPARVFEGRADPALVSRILNDMGSGPDQLPLMQHALMRLWKGSQDTGVLTVAAYEAIGGLEGALSGGANAAYESLDAEGQRITEVLFRRLSTRTASGRDIRLPTSLEEVSQVAEVTPQAVLAVVDVFRDPDCSFLTPAWPQKIGPDEILDISHESLIRHWDRLRGWVADEAASAEVYRRLDQTARLWSEGRAGLWGTPDLEQALRWKEEALPNKAWAARYDGDFDRATEFLKAGVAERDRKQAEEDQRRWKEDRRNRDLKFAAEIQKRFLPQAVPTIPGYEFFAHYEPVYEVGGDFYDFVPLPRNRLALTVGGVSGKGVAAALLMAKFSGDARFCILTEDSPAAAARELNKLVLASNLEDKFIMLSVGILDVDSDTFFIASAGHSPVLVRRANSTVEEIGDDIAGFPLGIVDDADYQETHTKLNPGDVAVLYSDGVTDARNMREELYDAREHRRLIRKLADTTGTPEAVGRAILEDIRKFFLDRLQVDDMTLVCFGPLARSS
jgi:serine phosphatase RsbU (regulator of sigma subunit)